MEVCNSQALSIESFSYSWLVNISHANSFRSSFDELNHSFIEMDPTMPPSKRFFSSADFNFPALSPSPSPSHADRLISNGYLIPVNTHLDASYEISMACAGVSPVVNKALSGEPRGKPCSLLRKSCRRISRQILEKYLNFVRPICRRIQGNGKMRSGSRAAANYECCSDEWRRSCDSETSIYDAVLHCKKSIGK